MEVAMSAHHTPEPNDPYARNDPRVRNSMQSTATWGWIAGAVVLLAILAYVIMTDGDTRMANDNTTRPPATTNAPAKPPAPANPGVAR
jgi:hypothetical protein